MPCYRGQVYCSKYCNKLAKSQQRKKSNLKYARSDKGRQAQKRATIKYLNLREETCKETIQQNLHTIQKKQNKQSNQLKITDKRQIYIDLSSNVFQKNIKTDFYNLWVKQKLMKLKNHLKRSQAPPKHLVVCKVCGEKRNTISQRQVFS